MGWLSGGLKDKRCSQLGCHWYHGQLRATVFTPPSGLWVVWPTHPIRFNILCLLQLFFCSALFWKNRVSPIEVPVPVSLVNCHPTGLSFLQYLPLFHCLENTLPLYNLFLINGFTLCQRISSLPATSHPNAGYDGPFPAAQHIIAITSCTISMLPCTAPLLMAAPVTAYQSMQPFLNALPAAPQGHPSPGTSGSSS
jgi:hypothetical protein